MDRKKSASHGILVVICMLTMSASALAQDFRESTKARKLSEKFEQASERERTKYLDLVEAAQTEYQMVVQRAEADYAERLNQIFDVYGAELKKILDEETKAGRLDAAIEVRDAIGVLPKLQAARTPLLTDSDAAPPEPASRVTETREPQELIPEVADSTIIQRLKGTKWALPYRKGGQLTWEFDGTMRVINGDGSTCKVIPFGNGIIVVHPEQAGKLSFVTFGDDLATVRRICNEETQLGRRIR